MLSCELLEDDVLNISRHLPVVCSASIQAANLSISNFDFHSHVKWDKLDKESKGAYRSDLGALLIKPMMALPVSMHTLWIVLRGRQRRCQKPNLSHF